jgi:hypothetical protein
MSSLLVHHGSNASRFVAHLRYGRREAALASPNGRYPPIHNQRHLGGPASGSVTASDRLRRRDKLLRRLTAANPSDTGSGGWMAVAGKAKPHPTIRRLGI